MFRRGFAYGLYFGGCIAFAFGALVLRFLNPSLTETEIFLRYWPVWVLGAIAVITGALWWRYLDER